MAVRKAKYKAAHDLNICVSRFKKIVAETTTNMFLKYPVMMSPYIIL